MFTEKELLHLKKSLLDKKNIEFIILNSKNEPVVINCHTCGNDKVLYRGGLAIKCNCQPEDGKINYLMYDKGRVYCPNCGREAINVKSEDGVGTTFTIVIDQRIKQTEDINGTFQKICKKLK